MKAKGLGNCLRRACFRLRWVRGIEWACAACVFAPAALLAAVLLDRLAGVGSWVWLAAASCAAAPVAAFFAGFVSANASRLRAALALDRELGLKERLSSALSCEEEEGGMTGAVVADAEGFARRVEPGRVFRPSAGLLPYSGAAFGVALLAYLLIPRLSELVPPLSEEKREEKLAVRSCTTEVRKAMRDLKLAEKRQKALDPSLQKLFRAKDKVEALKELDKLERKLESYKKRAKALKGLQEACKSTKKMGRGELSEFEKALAEGDRLRALNALQELKEKMAAGELDAAAMAELARQLESLAQSAKDEKLVELLNKLSEMASKLPSDCVAGHMDDLMSYLEGLTPEEIEEWLKALERARLELVALKRCGKCGRGHCPCCGQARCGCSGGVRCSCRFGSLAGLGSCAGAGANATAGGKGKGSGPPGQGQGKVNESEDDVSFKPVKVKGKLSSSTMISVRIKRGLPPVGKDLEEYVSACEAARTDAEDALAKERIPERRKRAVLQYFDSVGPEAGKEKDRGGAGGP